MQNRTEKEKMINGEMYDSSDEELLELRKKARLLSEEYNKSSVADAENRSRILDLMIPNHGKNAYIEPNIRIEYGTNISVGDNFFMNFDGQMLDVCPIKMGNDVFVGPRVTFATPVHPLLAEERNIKYINGKIVSLEYAKPITIGNNVWIASSVTICGGVTIGDDVVIGAGSVVTRDIPSGYVAFGVPCKPIRKISISDKVIK